VAGTEQPAGLVEGRAEVVAVSLLRLTGVYAHADLQCRTRRCVVGQAQLGGNRSGCSVLDPPKHDGESVA
jgi:hypothetical protein